jgi:thiol-disulfide isomerase/thioredoxin
VASPRFKFVVAVLAAATVGVYLAEPYLASHDYSQYKDAPAFELATIDGSTFNMSSQAGKVVLIDFMAVWCPPCREAMWQLKMVRGANAVDDLTILSVDIDYTESAEQLGGFREQYAGYNGSAEPSGWYFALDTLGTYVGPLYGATALPTLVLVDGAGHIRHTWVGATSASEIQGAIDGLG